MIVGRSTVYNTFLKMNALVTAVEVVSQGSYDITSNWAKARFPWVKQLAICYGVLDPRKVRDPPLPLTKDEENKKMATDLLYDLVDNAIAISIRVSAIKKGEKEGTLDESIASEIERNEVSKCVEILLNEVETMFPSLRLEDISDDDVSLDLGSDCNSSMSNETLDGWASDESVQQGERIDLSDIPEDNTKIYDLDGIEILECFDPRKLTKFHIAGTVWWDETHPDCKIGTAKNKRDRGIQVQVRFPRNKDGDVDVKNGTYSDKLECKMRVKYSEEIRICLGVAIVELHDGTREGRRCKMIDYTGKIILCAEEYESRVQKEIKRVKKLTGDRAPWVVKNIPDGYDDSLVWEQDPLSRLVGVTKGVAKSLLENKGIATVAQLRNKRHLTKTEVSAQLKVNRISVPALQRAIQQASGANIQPGTRPVVTKIDHKLAPNPYKSLYGDDWREKIKTCTGLSRSMSIHMLVQSIYDNSKEVFRGTKHEDNWYFYHDALSLMTADECKEYMQRQGILKHWILPQFGINEGTVYNMRPVGNSPEMMPLDSNLNKDIHEAAHSHCVYTADLPDTDPRKFSLNTPKRALNAYQRLWDPSLGPDAGVPSSKRIIEDVRRVVDEVLPRLFEARGATVKGLGTRTGRRRELNLAPLPRGGRRKKKETMEKKWKHPDAESALDELFRKHQN